VTPHPFGAAALGAIVVLLAVWPRAARDLVALAAAPWCRRLQCFAAGAWCTWGALRFLLQAAAEQPFQ
jgi:hypothetical protein